MSLLDLFISPAAAQTAAAGTAQQPQSLLGTFGFFAVVMVIMYFFMLRPQMKRQKEHNELVSKLAKGDEVITNGGLAGRIDDLGENFITLEIADGVRVKLQRGAIHAVLPKGTLKSA